MKRLTRSRIVLSIDFDGVLHPLDAAYTVNDSRLPLEELVRAGLFCHCQLLEDLLAAHDSVDLVIHSSWRLACAAQRMRELLGPVGHRMRVVTPVNIVDREASILAVLRRWQAPVSNLVVLDDQAFHFQALRDRLVHCPQDEGFPVVRCLRASRRLHRREGHRHEDGSLGQVLPVISGKTSFVGSPPCGTRPRALGYSEPAPKGMK